MLNPISKGIYKSKIFVESAPGGQIVIQIEYSSSDEQEKGTNSTKSLFNMTTTTRDISQKWKIENGDISKKVSKNIERTKISISVDQISNKKNGDYVFI